MRHVDGQPYVPVGTPHPDYIVPDEIVLESARDYGLLAPGLRGLDPMCGVGTIPRVISAAGGHCDGIEIDHEHFRVARSALPASVTLIEGDCLDLRPSRYDYIYTSPPFKLFFTPDDGRMAKAFMRMLDPGGHLVIDGADEIDWGSGPRRVADAQTRYFTDHGFRHVQTLRFRTNPRHGWDDQFTELLFQR